MFNLLPKGLAKAAYKKAAAKIEQSIELTIQAMAKELDINPYRLKLVFAKKGEQLWVNVFDDKNKSLAIQEIGSTIDFVFDQNLAKEPVSTRQIIEGYRAGKKTSEVMLEKMDGKARFIVQYNKDYELYFQRLEGGKLTPVDLVESLQKIEF